MAARDTFSLATLGIHARSVPAVQTITVGDAAAGRPGSQQMSMATNSQIYCKMPDGSFRWLTIDAERSRPGGPLYLLSV